MIRTQEEVDAKLTALGYPPPVGSLRDVQATIAERMGLHRCTVRVRLEGTRCVVEVPEENVDDRRRDLARKACAHAARFAAKAGANEIEIVAVSAHG